MLFFCTLKARFRKGINCFSNSFCRKRLPCKKMHRSSMGKEKPDVLFSFPVKESHFNNKPRTGCVQGLDLDIVAGQSVAYPNF